MPEISNAVSMMVWLPSLRSNNWKLIRPLPGLFISDIVGEKPLSENLAASPIMNNIPNFAIKALHQMLNVQSIENEKINVSSLKM